MGCWTLVLLVPLLALPSVRGGPPGPPGPDPQCDQQFPPPSCPPPPLPPPLPAPPRQTPAQRKLIAEVERKAEQASKHAKAVIVEWLGSQDFLHELDGCCAEIHAMSPEARLRWIDTEFAATEMVHNFGTSNNGGGPQSDETIRLGQNASFFYNLWEVALMSEEEHRPSGHHRRANCTEIDINHECGNGNCTLDDSTAQGFRCVCAVGFTGDDCDRRMPLDCAAQESRAACENISDASNMGFQLPDCKWVTASATCVKLGETKSPTAGRQTTDVAEVGLFGFPEFHNLSEAGYQNTAPTYADAIQRPIYTDWSNRKVDVGNPMFGPISAIFTPSFVRNMTLIAPIDTGAWEGTCNTTGHSFNEASDVKTCAMVQNESACNIDTGRYRTCDWRTTVDKQRGPVCVNSAVDRLECYHQITETSCKAAPGLPRPEDWGQHEPLSRVWADQLYNGGCSWETNSSTCSAFTCESLATAAACHLAAHPKMPNMSNHKPGTPFPKFPSPKHCVWDAHKDGGTCVKISPSKYCEMTLHPPAPPPDPFPPHGPPPPPQLPKELCIMGSAGELCRWEQGNNASDLSSGRCVPTHCEAIINASECSALSTGQLSCAWINATAESVLMNNGSNGSDRSEDESVPLHNGRCITYSGNCSVLPSESSCNTHFECAWNATGPDHSGPKHCHNKDNGHGPLGAWQFNCSNAAWYGRPDGDGPRIPNGSPGELTLGTPTHYYHTLAAGVSIWNDSKPATQLGVMVRRMADPYGPTGITAQEIFKYWEANIAGAPYFPAGVKMLVGSFAKLFGTDDGRRLQAWCKKEGWVLAWGLGAAGGTDEAKIPPHGDPEQTMTAPYANRTLDLQVLPHTTAIHNMTVSAQDHDAFERLWREVSRAVNASHHMPPTPPVPPSPPMPHNHSNHTNPSPPPAPSQPGVITNGNWTKWWRKMPSASKIGFLSGGSCADVDSCVGVLEGGHCVCYGDGLRNGWKR